MKKVTALSIIFLVTANILAATNYVSKTGNHISPFDSWANAATNIQDAVDVASVGNIVLVNDGTYYPGDQISITKEIVVKSLDGAENTIVNGNNANRCFYINGSIIDGFTITNGYNSAEGGGVFSINGIMQNCTISGNSTTASGGGVFCDYGKSIVQNCTISENSAQAYGGGVYYVYGGNIVQNCNIIGNSVMNFGGGLYCRAGTVQNCTFSNNYAREYGGGIYNSVGLVQDCIISRNSASFSSGGVECNGGTVQNCIISENFASSHGGGTLCMGGGGIVKNCIISSNSSSVGGGVYCSGTIQSCLIIENSAADMGGGVYSDGGTVQNCTITKNYATNFGGVYCNINSPNSVLQNSILWNNTTGNYYLLSGLNRYNCIENWTDLSNGIITNNPKFRDAAAGNYRLEEFSPCRNTGTNMPWMLTATDLDGNPRITGGRVDMGAYEFIPEPCLFLIVLIPLFLKGVRGI